MKMKSRKFWICVICAAYFALMALREQGIENTTGTIVCACLACIVTIGYIVMEGLIDSDKIEAGIEDDGEDE